MQVADELDVLAAQVAYLRAENERLTDQLELHRHGVIPSTGRRRRLPAAKEVNLLSAAQREAEQIIAQAHEYARRVAEYARVQYESYMQAAVEEARQEAERAVQDYRQHRGRQLRRRGRRPGGAADLRRDDDLAHAGGGAASGRRQ